MTSYYLDPERCFEIPFRIPLPDKDEMATRLANIHRILKYARERQSLSCAEHRRTLPIRPAKYLDKAKVIMKRGQLKRFVGNLRERYSDYLDFHRENLNDLSPLTIQIPALCSALSPPSPCLFGPPGQGDFNELVRSNLSWSQFAAPVPAGWRERFLQDRRWELDVERRALDEYSDDERKAEYAALESQRRRLGIILQMESNGPPPLQRKCPIPLPLSPLRLDMSTSEESAKLKREKKTGCDHSSRNTPDQSLVTEKLSSQTSHRPSLHVTIPGTEKSIPWFDGSLCDSPLSSIDPDVPPSSVLLNANAVRAYLDSVHGPHELVPQPPSPHLAYPQSPLQQLLQSKVMIEMSAEQMPGRDMSPHGHRKSLFVMASAARPFDPTTAPLSFTTHNSKVQQPQPKFYLKRQAGQDSTVAHGGLLKKPRPTILALAKIPHSQDNEKENSSRRL